MIEKYVSTRNNNLNKYLKNYKIINTYNYLNKKIIHYKIIDSNDILIIEQYKTGLTIIKSSNKLEIKGLVDVTNNPLYLDSNISNIKVSKAIIEGTDGVGKSITIEKLVEQGIVCFDRSETICKYMLFNVPMNNRVSAYKEYLNEIEPYYIIFLVNNSKKELENRINKRANISEFDKKAYEYNVLYNDTYKEMKKYQIKNLIEIVDCTGLTIDEQINKVKSCIIRRNING